MSLNIDQKQNYNPLQDALEMINTHGYKWFVVHHSYLIPHLCKNADWNSCD